MKPNYEQQARELMERITITLLKSVGLSYVQERELALVLKHELEQLNLAKLLEDAAMLDWLEKKFPVPNEFKVAWVRVSLGKENNSVRTAIRNAMNEDDNE